MQLLSTPHFTQLAGNLIIFPLLSVTVLCSEKRAYLVVVNEDIHRSSAQEGQSNLGRERESNELHLHFLSILYDV